MPPNQDRELLTVRLLQPRPVLRPQVLRWQAGHPFDQEGSAERRRLPGWQDSFAERRGRLRAPETFLSLRELPERPTKPVQFRVPRVTLKGSLKKDRAIPGPM